jgi:serine/threonine protein kinase/Tfp pilus assembly protein PilF
MPSASDSRDPLEQLAEEFAERYRRGERPSLSEYTARHPELAAEIRELFPALVEMEQLASVAGPHTGPYTPTAPAALPRQLGEYRILREVGRGGMGVVYEAVQESLGRHVALKVLPLHGLLDPTQLERFRREARAVARLHHSNIVPVFGIGECAGDHYYAMQFIQGHNLNTVLDEVRRLRESPRTPARDGAASEHSLSERVAQGLLSGQFAGGEAPAAEGRPADTVVPPDAGAAPHAPPSPTAQVSGPGEANGSVPLTQQTESQYFRSVARAGVQVAEALAYAHGQGILHRDIKPSNLLLDTRGTVWITDFGLAKAEGSDDLTDTGALVGTLRYMAPERFEGHCDARSEVYSVGVTLYEMLTLRPAFGEGDRLALLERVRSGETVPPRRCDPRVPRDLETIVLKAMARDPAARYATAEALAEDLRRFLADRPIRARRARVGEQVWRWCRRNPWLASLLAAVLLLLLVVAVGSTVFALRLREGIVELNGERNRTEQARQRTRAALDEMSSQVIEDWLARQGQLEPAQRRFLEKALGYYEEFAEETGNTEATRHGVAGAQLRVGDIRQRLGQHGEAEAAYRQAVELYARLAADFPAAPEYRHGLAATHNNLGLLLMDTGRPQEAESAFRDALELREALAADFPAVPQHRLEQAKSYNNLGLLLKDSGRPQAAEAAYRAALDLQKALAADFPNVPNYRMDLARTRLNLGLLLMDTGRPKEAEAAHRDALDIQKGMAADFPAVRLYRQLLAKSQSNLGVLLMNTGRPKEAEAAYRDALALFQRLAAEFPAVPQYHSELAMTHTNLGDLQSGTGSVKEAEAALRQALDLYQPLAADFPALPGYRAALATTHHSLGRLLANTGRLKEAGPPTAPPWTSGRRWPQTSPPWPCTART